MKFIRRADVMFGGVPRATPFVYGRWCGQPFFVLRLPCWQFQYSPVRCAYAWQQAALTWRRDNGFELVWLQDRGLRYMVTDKELANSR